MSPQPDSMSDDPQQVIAELRRQLDERTVERDEALARETATAEVLQVINASPGDLQPVFEAILEKAHSLCGATLGSLRLYDGQYVRTVAIRGHEGDDVDALRRGTAHSEGLVASLLQGAPFVQNLRARIAFERNGSRTGLMVPLRKDGALLGMIFAARQEVRPFTDKQIALLQNFAAQAVIAMENARLITETREALEQQTATAEVLQVINASPGDLASVFDAILEKTMRLCDAAFGTMTVKGYTVAARGVPDIYTEWRKNNPIPQSQDHIAEDEPFLHVVDMKDDNRYRSGDPHRRALVDLAGARTYLVIPLRRNQELLGWIQIYRQEVRPFGDKQIALLQNFATQAVIAMENARLLTETHEALERQTATAELLQVINSSSGDLEPVFEAILEKAHGLCGAAFGGLLIYDGDLFRAAAMHNVPADFTQLARQPFRPGPQNGLTRLIEGAPLIHIVDVAKVAAAAPDDTMLQAAVDQGGIRTLLLVPLRREESFLGAITAYRQHVEAFTDQQIALLENFAAQAVVAIENARLLGELRQRTEEVKELNRGLETRVAEQVEELGRVGRLKRFLAPQLAELIVARGDENILETHRRDIVVVFCDLRGFTSFAETAEPEEVLELLREYHGALGPIVSASEGTLDHFSGDGIMVFFNDPVPVPDASERAVRMAIEMRAAAARLQTTWRRQGREIGFGVGIARGYATLGQIGFADRIDYTAIGTVCNLAARLCAEAKDGQILISRRVAAAVENKVPLEEVGDLALKGLLQAVAVYNIGGELEAS